MHTFILVYPTKEEEYSIWAVKEVSTEKPASAKFPPNKPKKYFNNFIMLVDELWELPHKHHEESDGPKTDNKL